MPLSQSDIVSSLAKLGLQPTSRVMVHASLSVLGPVEGGASTVVSALREATGAEGAVIIPSFRDAIRSDYYALRSCREVCPRELCPSQERGYTGIIGETVGEQPDSVRSCHPTTSWVGIGRSAASLLTGHGKSLTPCGYDSPFFRLLEQDGHVLLLGVGVNSITNIHAVEDARNVPYLSAIDPPNRHATYTTSGKRLQYVYPGLLHDLLRECGLLQTGRVGLATCHLISARALGSFLWVVTEDDPWCLVLRPRGAEYRPFEDACAKVAAMARAWRANPDGEAWRLLLEQSRRPVEPVHFHPVIEPVVSCPAYAGVLRGSHRCHANDLPPWEKFDEYPGEPGAATCDRCNWPLMNGDSNNE